MLRLQKLISGELSKLYAIFSAGFYPYIQWEKLLDKFNQAVFMISIFFFIEIEFISGLVPTFKCLHTTLLESVKFQSDDSFTYYL